MSLDHDKWSLRAGAAVIVCALTLRLAAGGVFDPLVRLLAQPNTASLLIYLETGRIVRFSDSQEEPTDFATVPVSAGTLPPEADVPCFSAADGAGVEIRGTATAADPAELIQTPLEWDLTGDEPTVLILHTHATESFTPSPGEDYRESSPYRTLDTDYNMVSVGAHVAKLLEAGGVRVIHDRQLHDYPDYNTSYNHARERIRAYLAQYPSIRLVLDLHRDASGDNSSQLTTAATVDGEPSAQLMLVIAAGTDTRPVPEYRQNLALGLKLQVQAERIAPGICRYVNLRASRFNQDLSPGALLVEVGAAGNSHPEALKAAEVLAQAILALSDGANH